jgi:hypothetical protein
MRWALCCVLIGVGVLSGDAFGQQTLTAEEARRKVAALKPTDELDLSKVTALPPEAAKELVRHAGVILLPGLTEISPETAEWLARHTGYLRLSGLAQPSAEVLKILGRHRGVLHVHLPTLLLKHIRGWDSSHGWICYPLVSAHEATLHVTGADSKEIGTEWLGVVARKRAGRLVFWGWATFDGRRGCPDDLMATTAKLEFPDIERISERDAKTLAGHKGLELSLGIKSMDAPVAMALRKYPGLLVLPRMTALTASAAQELRKCSGVIHLPNLTTATEETRAILKGHPRIETPALED